MVSDADGICEWGLAKVTALLSIGDLRLLCWEFKGRFQKNSDIRPDGFSDPGRCCGELRKGPRL